MIEYSDLNAEFIIKRFPELNEQVEEMSVSGEFLPHVIFGNVFNQLTVSLLKRDDYLKNKALCICHNHTQYHDTQSHHHLKWNLTLLR